MKKLVVILTLALLQITLLNAQGRMSPKERAKDLKDKLELNNDQYKKIESIFEESAAKVKDVRDKNSGDRGEMMKALIPINQEAEKRVDSLLTDKQKEQYDKIKKERREKIGRRLAPRQ